MQNFWQTRRLRYFTQTLYPCEKIRTRTSSQPVRKMSFIWWTAPAVNLQLPSNGEPELCKKFGTLNPSVIYFDTPSVQLTLLKRIRIVRTDQMVGLSECILCLKVIYTKPYKVGWRKTMFYGQHGEYWESHPLGRFERILSCRFLLANRYRLWPDMQFLWLVRSSCG